MWLTFCEVAIGADIQDLVGGVDRCPGLELVPWWCACGGLAVGGGGRARTGEDADIDCVTDGLTEGAGRGSVCRVVVYLVHDACEVEVGEGFHGE